MRNLFLFIGICLFVVFWWNGNIVITSKAPFFNWNQTTITPTPTPKQGLKIIYGDPEVKEYPTETPMSVASASAQSCQNLRLWLDSICK